MDYNLTDDSVSKYCDDESQTGNSSDTTIHQAKRLEELGFIPQTELVWNKYLPYADQIDDESQKMLAEIKDNFAKTILLRDIKPGSCFAVNQLIIYIKLYGLKFSKTDHINFIKLLLELIMIPKLEPSIVNNYLLVLSALLRKWQWIRPDELHIDWRIFYELSKIYLRKSSKSTFYRYMPNCNKFFEEPLVKAGQQNQFLDSLRDLANQYGIDLKMFEDYLPNTVLSNDANDNESLESNLQYVIQQCTVYFSKNSTQEILDELYPKILPLDTGRVCGAFNLLTIFLNPMDGHELWLNDFMNLWNTYHNPSWNVDMMSLIALTAVQNIGRIDWEPHLPVMFTRILRSFDLPVCYKGMKSTRSQSLWASSVALWIGSILGPKSSAQKHLTYLMGAIESYLHPANSGKWVNTITEIIINLPNYLFHRLKYEQFKQKTWLRPVRDEDKLTENCITEFVESLKPVAFQAMYSRLNASDVGRLFQFLADLRPELIIPGIIDRVYSTLDSVTEPHKMTASLQCLVSVSRALVTGHNGYTTGKTHVIPILHATLPGIDSNDLKKTSVTLQFLTSFALLVPLVDCSKASLYHDDLTEEESLICDQTSEFEGFVLEFLDRIFALIESSAQDTIRMEQSDLENLRSRMESIVETLLQSAAHGILGQASDSIIAAAIRKFIDFIQTRLFEVRVAAHLVAALVRVFARAAPQEIRKTLVPYLCGKINQFIIEHEDVRTIEKQGDEFLYYVILLTSVVRGDPHQIIDIIDDVLPIVDHIMTFECKLTNRYGNSILINILSTISSFQTMDVKSCPFAYSKSLKEFLPIRHWGKKMTKETPITWYMPDERARSVCERIIHRYMPNILQRLDDYVAGGVQIKRDDILRDTSIVLALLKCANFLPNWKPVDQINLTQSLIASKCSIDLKLGIEHLTISMPDGGNVREAVIRTMTGVQRKVLQDNEDDTKTLRSLVMIWDRVHMQKQTHTPFDSQMKTLNNMRQFQDYKLVKRKSDLRLIFATRILMQQDLRDELLTPRFTRTHQEVIKNLLTLSTSHYSAVRISAQSKLFNLLCVYPNSYKCILDDIIGYLAQDSNENHESFKGILYVIGGQRRSRLIVTKSWTAINRIWLGLLKTNLSEKPSVIRIMDMISSAIISEFPTINIEIDVPDECLKRARALLGDRINSISDTEIENGRLRMIEKNCANLKLYNDTLHEIVTIKNNNSLHWRYDLMASRLISILMHPFVDFPAEVIKSCVNNLANESLEERKVAITSVLFILYKLKRKHVKIDCKPFEISGTKPLSNQELKPGNRPDNSWLQYDRDTVPKSQEEWDRPVYLHKNEGFYGWSPSLKVYAPTADQPKLDRTPDEFSAVEKIVDDFFSNPEQFKRLIEFWSLEEKKSKEKFTLLRCKIIKYLFTNFGDRYFDAFLMHLEKLITEQTSIESNHRCAAEMLAGMLCGMKHWSYDKTAAAYEKLIPIIRLALNSITVDTDDFWGTCFLTASENFDPKRQHWLHEVLLENPVRETTSFIDCSRLYCLQGCYNHHVWRMTSVSHRLLNYLRPYLDHPFQNVRERIGCILINIFEADLQFVNGPEPICPRIKDLMAEVMKKLSILNSDEQWMDKVDQSTEPMQVDGAGDVLEQTLTEEYKKAVRLFKTMCHWILGILNRSTNGNVPEYLELMPIACRLERCEQDAELAENCSQYLAMVSQALTLPDCMGAALNKIDFIASMTSWSARLAVIDVLQVLIFNNMSIVLSKDEWVQQVQTIVLRLLEDPVVEVRIKAAQVLGGLLHCSFLPATDKLLELFKKKCRTKVIKNSTRRLMTTTCASEVGTSSPSVGQSTPTAIQLSVVDAQEAESVRMRHMGVLGLCAFISAYPYDIPDFFPDVFEHLGAHLNDPQPIPSTIRKTVGDFKRTHHDNWATHQLKFTEDQLAVLSDLTIPPSYYA